MLNPRMAARHAMNPVEEAVEPSAAPDDGEVAETIADGADTGFAEYADYTGTPTWRDARVPYVMLVMLGLCAAAFGAILYAARNLDFYFDEWSFIGTAARWRLRDYFEPHNEHWSTVPMVIYKVLLDTVGMHSYLPYMAVLLLLHVSAGFLLFLIVRRRCGDMLGLCAGTILLFLGRGYENILWAFQIGFLGSVVFGLLALYLLGAGGDELPSRRRAIGASAALLLALMSSGMGLVFFAAAAVDLLLDSRRRRLLWVHIVPGLAYLWWYFAFGRQAVAGDPSPFHDPLKTLEGLVGYAPTGIGSATAGVFALSELWGPIALAGLAATAAVLWYRNRLDSGLSIAAAVAIVLQYTLTGLVRAQYGSVQATAPRYVYIGAVFVLVILAEALRGVRWLGLWRAVAPVTAACIVVGGAAVLLHENTVRTNTLSLQKKELEITWLFRDAPSLDRGVVLDHELLPVVSPAIYIAARNRYGTPLPTITLADLSSMKPRDVNGTLRNLLPLVVTPTNGTAPPNATCGAAIAPGSLRSLTVAGGAGAWVGTIGKHAASQVMFTIWAMGRAPDGEYQQRDVSSSSGLYLRFPDTGLGLSWHFRLSNAGGNPVSLCVGAH